MRNRGGGGKRVRNKSVEAESGRARVHFHIK